MDEVKPQSGAVITKVLTDFPAATLGGAPAVHFKVSGLIELINQCFACDGYVDVMAYGNTPVASAVQLNVVDHVTVQLFKPGSAAVVEPGMQLYPCRPEVTVFHHRRKRYDQETP